MIKVDPKIARYLFEAANLVPEAFHVLRFHGEEELSRLFRFEIDLASEDPYLDFSKIINNPATFFMKRGDEMLPIAGIVSHFEQAGQNLDADYTVYRAVLVPRLWRLTLNFQSRIYQNLTVLEIVEMVLKDNGFSGADYRLETQETYEQREYCVQYQETDLNFVQRLLEYEGISYFFEHDKQKETLVITDKQDAFKVIGGKDEVPYLYRHRHVEGEYVDQFICKERLVPGEFVLNDYNYRTPTTDLTVSSQINGDMPGRTYIYGQHYKDTASGKRLVRVRNEEIESSRRVLHGQSDCPGLRAGHRFSLTEHYRADFNEEYLVTRVEHQGAHRHVLNVAYGDGAAAQELPYRNVFTCLPASVTYRPPRITPVPRIHGIMTATVIGDSDYAALDDWGRYQANMHFDLDKEGSRPIRMAQPYTGKGKAGFHLPPHPGTEMVWSAIDGDPDRPFAIVSGPNPDHEAPVIDENNSQHIFRTTSNNLYLVEDRHGKERITLHTPRHETILSLGDTHEFGNEGATLTTDEKVLVRGSKGIVMQASADGFYLSGWPDVGSGGIGQALMMAIPIATALVGAITGKFIDSPPPISNVVKFAMKVQDLWSKANVAAKGAKALLGPNNSYTKFMEGFGTPGMFFTCQGGIDFVNPEGFSVTTGGGFSVLTPQEAKITAANDIGLITGANIGMYARHGHIQMVADTKDIFAKAVSGNIVHRAKKGVVTSAGGPIFLKAGDATEDLQRKSFGSVGKDILGKFKKKDTKKDTEYVLPPTDQDKRIQLNAEDGIYIASHNQDVIIQSEKKGVAIAGEKVALGGEKGVEIFDETKQIELKCGQSRILLEHNGNITIEGMNITIKATKDVKIEGMNVTSEAQMKSMTKGTMVNVEASGINTIKGSLVKIN